jgi:hypothetical protein
MLWELWSLCGVLADDWHVERRLTETVINALVEREAVANGWLDDARA